MNTHRHRLPFVFFLWLALCSCLALAIGCAQSAPRNSKFLLGADISALAGGGGRGFRGRAGGGGVTNAAATNASSVDTNAAAGAPAVDNGRRVGPGGYQENGQPGTEISIMMNHNWNLFRLRVFVDPVRSAPNNCLSNTIPLAKQIKAAGAVFLLDIHYSDTWADPQHQETPLAWQDIDTDHTNQSLSLPEFRDLLATYGTWPADRVERDMAALEKRVEQYSSDVITQLKQAGAMPDIVQVGNEITGGTLWPFAHVRVPPSSVKLDAGRIQALPDPYDDDKQWNHLIRVIKAGMRGVRSAAAGPVQIVMHIDCGGDWPVTQWYFDHLTQAHVDYDIIGQSFYPNYHGTPELLQANMIECARAYHKPFLVAETGYPQSGGDAVMTQRKYNFWPGTPQGQLQFMADLVNTVKRAPGGLGVVYWAPEGRGFGNGLWTSDGIPAPAISVLDNLSLTNAPQSHLPSAPPSGP
jgi:arabinogalactan endo-1,4-beta-galactosidase